MLCLGSLFDSSGGGCSVTYVPVTPVLLLRTELSYHTVQLCAVRLRCDEYCIPAGDRSSAVGRQGPVRVQLRSGAVASRLSVSLGSQPQYCQAAGYAVLPVRLSLRDCWHTSTGRAWGGDTTCNHSHTECSIVTYDHRITSDHTSTVISRQLVSQSCTKKKEFCCVQIKVAY